MTPPWGGIEPARACTVVARVRVVLLNVRERVVPTKSGWVIRQRRLIRFCLAPRVCAPCGPSARVVPGRLTKPSQTPAIKISPLCFKVAYSMPGAPVWSMLVIWPAMAPMAISRRSKSSGCSLYLLTKKSGDAFRVGIFLDFDFVWLTTRAIHHHGAYVQGGRRNRIDPPWGWN